MTLYPVDHKGSLEIIKVNFMTSTKEAQKEKDSQLKAAKLLPEPTGWKLLVAPVPYEKKTEAGIWIPDERVDAESVATIVALVLKMGSLAYKDDKKFPTGPWCKEGDFVIFKAYSGVRLKVKGKEFRLINDDTIEAVVEDPRGIVRA